MKKHILGTLLMLGFFMPFSFTSWAGDDAVTAKKRAACNKGNSASCFVMGERYRVVEQDNKTALKFYRESCKMDYMTACTHGGILLFMAGKHSSAEWKEAKKMFLKACDAGEDPACYNMGTLSYKEGRQKRALKYYKQACKMGNKGGCVREQRLKR